MTLKSRHQLFQDPLEKLPARVYASDTPEDLSMICDASGTPDCPERNLLIDDAAALADLFSSIMSTRYIELRFDVVTNNACRKFHIDAVKARLICTYRGTGTQYVSSANGASGQHVQTVPTGAAIMLRCTRWRDSARSDLLHRSPPIEGTGETRLVLVLDPAEDPDPPFTATHTAYGG